MIELAILALLPCINFDTMDFHIHVKVEGMEIPANIGVSPGCFREIHTHTTDGWLHLESSGLKDFTLRQFFEVWGTNEHNNNNVTINGQDATIDTPLRDRDKVVIGP